MSLAYNNKTPCLLAWHHQDSPRPEALTAFPYFNELPSKMLAQEDSFIAAGDKYGWSYHALAGGERTIRPDIALQELSVLLADPTQFPGFYNYHGFFKPFVVKFFSLLDGDVALPTNWHVCDLAWIYKAYLLGISEDRFRTVEDIEYVLSLKSKGATKISALAKALELDVPRAESFADNDFVTAQAVYHLVFANT